MGLLSGIVNVDELVTKRISVQIHSAHVPVYFCDFSESPCTLYQKQSVLELTISFNNMSPTTTVVNMESAGNVV